MNRHYMEGFCKTAAAYGVDPQELYKQAKVGFFKTLGQAFGTARQARAAGTAIPALTRRGLNGSFFDNAKTLFARRGVAADIKNARNVVRNTRPSMYSDMPAPFRAGTNPTLNPVEYGEGAMAYKGQTPVLSAINKNAPLDALQINTTNARLGPINETAGLRQPTAKELVNYGKKRIRLGMSDRGLKAPNMRG